MMAIWIRKSTMRPLVSSIVRMNLPIAVQKTSALRYAFDVHMIKF